jgi:hypothetical protein
MEPTKSFTAINAADREVLKEGTLGGTSRVIFILYYDWSDTMEEKRMRLLVVKT